MPKTTSTDTTSIGLTAGATRPPFDSELGIQELSKSSIQPRSEVAGVLTTSAQALTGFAILYVCFLILSDWFPYMRPGDNLVSGMKHDQAKNGAIFRSSKGAPTGDPKVGRLHVIAFGYSKTLTGFVPALFDKQLAGAGFPAVESYNFGLPGDERFIFDLESMVRKGDSPDIALLTAPWPATPEPGPTLFHFINHDQEMMDQLFPFHNRVRDFFILLAEAHGFTRIPDLYEQGKRSIQQIVADRGYYFMERQSHFANNELPSNFRLPTDTPDVVEARDVKLGSVYQQLATVLAANHIECIFVPKYYREGEFAPPEPINKSTAKLIAGQANLDLIGPDYYLYPRNLFSDHLHANRQGAPVYTTALSTLVADWLKRHPDKFSQNSGAQ